MNNKQVMAKLEAYFLEQEPETVAHVAASFLIDMDRMYFIERLSNDEVDRLLLRVEKDSEALRRFARGEDDEKLVLQRMNSDGL